jgi:hypothetical protein
MIGSLLETFVSSTTFSALGLGFMVLAFGFQLLLRLRADHPLAPYAVQIFALIVILPVVLALTLTNKFPTEAVTGLLGTIVGFFFGGAQHGRQSTAVTACTEATPQQKLAYCQEYSTWATAAPSAARNCAVPSIASRDVGYDLGSISQ